MSTPEPDRDDADLKALFAALPDDVPSDAVNSLFLEQLRARSLAEFSAAAPAPVSHSTGEQTQEIAPSPPGASPSVATQPVATQPASHSPAPYSPAPHSPSVPVTRKRTMFPILFRSLTALSAVVAGVALWLTTPSESHLKAASFSKVLDRMAKVDSLHLQIVQSEKPIANIWVQSPGMARIEESPTRYRIVHGGSQWRIDEQANQLTSLESSDANTSLFLGSTRDELNLQALLELSLPSVDQSSPASIDLHDLIPVKRINHDGRDCFVYQKEITTPRGRMQLEALADARTFELHSLVVRDFRERPARERDGRLAEPDKILPPVELRLIAMNVPVDESKFVVATTLSDDGRVGKVTDVQGIVSLRPLNAQRWSCARRDLIAKPGDWIRTELRGANAVSVSLTSQTQLIIGPGSLVEVLSPTQVRMHSGEMQVAQPGAAPDPKGDQDKPDKDAPKPAAQKEGAVVKLTPFVVLAPQTGSHTFDQPGKQLVRVTKEETLLVSSRVDADAPMWLKGFEGATSNESLGSLIVKLPDGRTAPLTVGVHKVSVDIRDQIARTTIEETFVNHTGTRLEGVFHFPLPQEASISGFGMWIGNELVEADIVEKQRAREIYEMILHEKRDPGLLEWTGGNIFSARVFPIEPLSEKRVKIVYTQVLPLRANRYRYNYGLRSELLQTRPLRELGLTVTVQSAIPLKQVKCSSHPARIQQTATSGRVEYAAQEVTPTRDFEVVCEIDGRQSDVVMIPHRRGDDGYFLLQLTPPSPAGNWQREVLPEGKPLDLLLLCDTSGSMDREKRKQQLACVASLLSALGPADRFNVATVDVRPEWMFDQQTAPSEDSLAKVRQTLESRVSLGWTDLDKAFDAARSRAGATTHIVYVGDGIVSTVEADPQAFLKRQGLVAGPVARAEGLGIEQKPEGSNKGSDSGKDNAAPAKQAHSPIHTIGVGNSFESVVLQGLSRLTGGSSRQVAGEMTPSIVAMELLNEIAQPGLSDVTVDFRGIKVAAVYPNKLPNVAAGTQQIIVGRYLPEAQGQTGEVVISAKRGGETVRYSTKVTLPERRKDSPASLKEATPGTNPPPRETDPDDDASFIPRLWARGRLDELLHQGSGSLVRDEIIALSEEFHIITPYTSLLVLESDADRERFGVKRRFEMRDGERFFAEGRSKANEELRQQQFRQAAGHRLELRQRILQELAKLGRHPLNWQPRPLNQLAKSQMPLGGPVSFAAAGSFDVDGGMMIDRIRSLADKDELFSFEEDRKKLYIVNGRLAKGLTGGFAGRDEQFLAESLSLDDDSDGFHLGDDYRESGRNALESSPVSFGGGGFGRRGSLRGVELAPTDEIEFTNGTLVFDDWHDLSGSLGREARFEMDKRQPQLPMTGKPSLFAPQEPWDKRRKDVLGGIGVDGIFAGDIDYEVDGRADREWFGSLGDKLDSLELVNESEWSYLSGNAERKKNVGYYGYRQPQPDPRQFTQWFRNLFPALPSAPSKRFQELTRKREERSDRESKWSPEAVALSQSLLRRATLAKVEGGLEIVRTAESFDPRWSRRTGVGQRLELYSPTAWLTRPLGVGHTVVNWSNATTRGVFSLALQVGRIRSAVETDRDEIPLELDDWSLSSIHRSYRTYPVRIEPAGENRVKLIVSFAQPPSEDDDDVPAAEPVMEYRLLIDTSRHVVLQAEQGPAGGKPQYTKSFGDHVEVAGQWWPQVITVVDPEGRKTSEVRQKVTLLAKEPFQQRIETELAPQAQMLLAGESRLVPVVKPGDGPQKSKQVGTSVADARQRVADGKATIDDRLVLILHACLRQDLAQAKVHLDGLEKLAVGKPGVRWVRAHVYQALRENEQLRQQLMDEAARLAQAPQSDVARDAEHFLAEHTRGMAFSITGYPEYLELLTVLRPVYERQPDHMSARLEWLAHQAGCFQAMSRLDEELAIRKQLATEQPWEVSHHLRYVERLEARGDRAAADAWIRQQIDRRVADGLPKAGEPVEWHEYELNQFFQHQANVLTQRGDYEGLVAWCVGWAERMPNTSAAYSHWLSALVFHDRYVEAERLATQWIHDVILKGLDLPPPKRTRFDVATEFALGRIHNLYMQEIDPTWHGKLPEAALAFMHGRKNFEIGRSLFGQIDSREFDEVDGLRLQIFRKLVREAATLDTARLTSFAQWSLTGRMKLPSGDRPATDELAFFREVDLQAMKARPMSADAINAAWKSLGDRREFQSSEVPTPIWTEIAKVVRLRWETEQKKNRKRELGHVLLNIYQTRMRELRIPFLRDLLAAADEDHQPAAALALFDALLAEPWTEANEKELFGLLPRLARKTLLKKPDGANEGERLITLVPALQRLVDGLINAREAATLRELLDGGQAHALTRPQLAEKRSAAKRDARADVADRLASLVKQQPNTGDAALMAGDDAALLGPWMEIESLTLDVQLGRNWDAATAAAWKWVDQKEALGQNKEPQNKDDKKEADANNDEDLEEDELLLLLDKRARAFVLSKLQDRAFALLMHLVVRKSAPAGDAARLLAFIDGRIAAAETAAKEAIEKAKAAENADAPANNPDAPQKEKPAGPAPAAESLSPGVRQWRAVKYRLLVALDRPEELERQLRAWIAADKSLSPWRVTLGWLQAERGGLPEAVQLFEAAQKDGLLGAREVRALSDWYLVLDRREEHRRAKFSMNLLRNEYELYQLLNQKNNQLQQPDATSVTELDEETLLLIDALLRKSTSPESYFWPIRELYRKTRDFRALAQLPDASLGRTPQEAYRYLNAVRNQLLDDVQNEATTDPIIARIRTLRDAPVKPGATDRDVSRESELRALDLLEALVESQASRVLNQPGPHVSAAVMAMQRAFQRKWSEGEHRLMANHLSNLGAMPHQPLIDEQLRELKALSGMVPAGSNDHLHIEWFQASLLHWHYQRRDEAEKLMDVASRLYLEKHDGKWHPEDQDVLAGWLGLLNDLQHYARGEAVIADREAKPFNEQQLPWLREQWFALQSHALGRGGETSLGKGATLLKKLTERQVAEIRATKDGNHRYNLLQRMPSVYQAAHNRNVKEAAGLFREFAFKTWPELMQTQLVNYSAIVNQTVSALDQVLGPKDALWWLAERFESYPKRLEFSWENPWHQHGYALGQYRKNCADKSIPLGDAEPVVLRVVLKELRCDLTLRQQRQGAMTRIHNHVFWSEKFEDFSKVAEEVLAAKPDSGRVQRYVAEYLFHGLNRYDRAIEVLFAARQKGLLDASGESVLIGYLMDRRRFGEAIALLEPLVKSEPDVLSHRMQLMRAYHETKRPQQVRDLLAATDAHFHKEGRWTEAAMADLAQGCASAGLAQESVKYYTEAISYHQRHSPGRGIGDHALWGYYHNQAHQYISLGQTREAVDAASSALICFPPRHHQREYTMNTLRSALQQSRDLNGYIAFLDERAKTDKQDSALLRKTIGHVLKDKNQAESAIGQFKLALELQPLDQETQQMLMEVLDAVGRRNEATQQLLSRIDLERHNLDLYKQLAERMKGDEAQSERAATSIVEAAPNEASHHVAIAEFREQQNRWEDALSHWQQVVTQRNLDPTGFIRLAKVQAKLKQTDAAKETLKHLEQTTWPPRYTTIKEDIRRLKETLR